MKKTQKGFTLVELIVVIAIIGVLAAILVPVLMNYVKKSKIKANNADAKLVFTTVNAAVADLVAEGESINDGDCTYDGKIKELTDTGIQGQVKSAITDDGKKEIYYSIVKTKNDVNVKFAQARSAEGDSYVGQYPNPSAVGKLPTWGTERTDDSGSSSSSSSSTVSE